MTGKLSINETKDRVILSWLGLHAAFSKDGLPEKWQAAIRDQAGTIAVFDWLADFDSLDQPDEIWPGMQLNAVLQYASGVI